MFTLTKDQVVTVRHSLDFYPRPYDEDHVLIVDGPVTVRIVDVVTAPSGSDTHYNVDVEVIDPIYGGLTTNIDLEADDLV